MLKVPTPMLDLSQSDVPSNEGRGNNRAASRPLRVLVIAPSLDMVGGQSVQADYLVRYLRREPSLEISLLPINPRMPGALVRLQRVRYVRTVVTSAIFCAHLLAQVPRYDLIHIFSASYYSFLLAPTPGVLAARLFGKRALLNYHSGEAEDHLQRWRHTAIPTIRLADAVAVPSNYLVDVFQQFGLTATAVFNVSEIERFHFRERRPLRPIILANRILEPLYNVGCTLRAFAIIQQQFPEARLIVANDGPQRRELERLARTLDLRHTDFIGRIAPSDVPELYDAADIYMNSSDIDNMPLSILEAFASGLPVVTTDAGGIPYVVTDRESGLLVRRGDHEALAAAAVELLRDDELASRLTRNARVECQKYTWATVRSQWLELYRRLMEGQTPRGGRQRSTIGVSGRAAVTERLDRQGGAD